MSKTVKTWLIVAAVLMAIGLIIFLVALSSVSLNFMALSTAQLETNNYEINDAFSNLQIDAQADVVFSPSSDGQCKVVCYEYKNMNHSVSVVGDTLTINASDSREWYERIVIFAFSSPKITIYLPQTEYASLTVKSSTGSTDIPSDFKFEDINITSYTGDVKCYASVQNSVKIKLTTGDINISDISAKNLELSVTTGKITASGITSDTDFNVKVTTGDAKLKNITCQNFTSKGNTGDIFMENVISAGNMYVERDTGDIRLNGCDAAEMTLKTDTGDVKGSLLSEKIFYAHSDTGKVKVPGTTSGGKCEIDTDTGNIIITVQP